MSSAQQYFLHAQGWRYPKPDENIQYRIWLATNDRTIQEQCSNVKDADHPNLRALKSVMRGPSKEAQTEGQPVAITAVQTNGDPL